MKNESMEHCDDLPPTKRVKTRKKKLDDYLCKENVIEERKGFLSTL
jgi:hypothetical protein